MIMGPGGPHPTNLEKVRLKGLWVQAASKLSTILQEADVFGLSSWQEEREIFPWVKLSAQRCCSVASPEKE